MACPANYYLFAETRFGLCKAIGLGIAGDCALVRQNHWLLFNSFMRFCQSLIWTSASSLVMPYDSWILPAITSIWLLEAGRVLAPLSLFPDGELGACPQGGLSVSAHSRKRLSRRTSTTAHAHTAKAERSDCPGRSPPRSGSRAPRRSPRRTWWQTRHRPRRARCRCAPGPSAATPRWGRTGTSGRRETLPRRRENRWAPGPGRRRNRCR